MGALIELFAVVILSGGINSNQIDIAKNVVEPKIKAKFTNDGTEYHGGKKPKKSSIHGIDLAAFWAFNTIYLLFNIVYWIKYGTY